MSNDLVPLFLAPPIEPTPATSIGSASSPTEGKVGTRRQRRFERRLAERRSTRSSHAA
jgi:hypothetical protein